MTPTEFVAMYCKHLATEPNTTQRQIAKDLALSVAANDTKETKTTDGTKIEADRETPNALAFIALVPACQVFPLG
ncbi:hypothetical protein [Nocardia anaemiae]|uniref:hypothetical protein n=1 Tax=Nocardia anaemiae TaxID=263910 RepID=UPI0007A55339|nr:hypothetical protein [Nocardia anaemiae]